jgi:hypothetical protein
VYGLLVKRGMAVASSSFACHQRRQLCKHWSTMMVQAGLEQGWRALQSHSVRNPPSDVDDFALDIVDGLATVAASYAAGGELVTTFMAASMVP